MNWLLELLNQLADGFVGESAKELGKELARIMVLPVIRWSFKSVREEHKKRSEP
jgi:hypothetical protein